MEIKVDNKDYNGLPFTASLSDYTNKWFANYNFEITSGGKTEEEALDNLKEKAKEMIEKINKVIYK